ncbi:MAG TPA: alpha-amylase family glycosyl hydrolase [Verrucomicrobiae bacterium]|jgi:glycosidase|nr:alpha-amylase family glycosyl hydrolase [Verrucomicrobiae bacterium]
MNHPLLFEINTRCWLRLLSEQAGREVTLADVPDSEFVRWQQLGFTHIWAMGVWTTGPRCRLMCFDGGNMEATFNRLVPGWKKEDVPGSPYAIAEYKVSAALGGEAGLKAFRKKLHAHGMKLLLDFVPNHMGLDHPWATKEPDHFMQSPGPGAGVFEQETVLGPRWLAHGKDPNFAAWPDTIQMNYRRPETRAAMIEILKSVAERCDGVRCDMSMLLLNDVFARTWAHLPDASPAPKTEFWPEAIGAVKQAHPQFIFLAEAYWGLEGRLQSLGFDYTYNKTVYDLLANRHYGEVQPNLLSCPPEYLAASAHFLENHDEPRIAPILSPAENRAAALLVLGLPGMRFLYEGQLDGRRSQIPVQLGRWPDELVNEEIATAYEQLLTTIKDSCVGRSMATLLRPNGWPDNQSSRNIVAVLWQKSPVEFDLVVVNLAPHTSQGVVVLPVSDLASKHWQMRDLLGTEKYQRPGSELAANGLYLDLAPHHAQLFRFEPHTH